MSESSAKQIWGQCLGISGFQVVTWLFHKTDTGLHILCNTFNAAYHLILFFYLQKKTEANRN